MDSMPLPSSGCVWPGLMNVSSLGVAFTPTALGIFPSALFDPSVQDVSTIVAPGTGILLYTDGLAECENDQGEQLGESAIYEALESSTSSSAKLMPR